MRFSIVIPAYNYAEVLSRAVTSACIEAGERDDAEVLVIDDGSTDDTPAVLEQLKQRYPRLRALRQANAGLAAVRNRGVTETAGEYLVFLDADDQMLAGALTAFDAASKAHPGAGLLIAPTVSVFPDGREETGSSPSVSDDAEQRFLDYLEKRLRLANGAVAMHRGLFDTLQYNPALRQTEDIPVFAQALALRPCAVVDRPVVRIFKHAGSMRHDAEVGLAVGMRLVDEVFDSQRLPVEMMKYRRRYTARRALSLFRLCYRARRYTEARRLFIEALRTDWRLALSDPGRFAKFLRTLVG